MKILVVKTSSLGDVVHALPAVTDAAKAIPEIRFDWVVEEGFAEIPGWHPAVERVIPVATRRWRKKWNREEVKKAIQELRQVQYDLIIDAQGLYKSALITSLARGKRVGLDWNSCREPLASLFYQKKINVPKGQHAIDRLRQLFSKALGYQYEAEVLDYGLDRQKFLINSHELPYLVFLHGTTWETKLWPEVYWIELAAIAEKEGYKVYFPWGNASEKERAVRMASQCSNAIVPDKKNLQEMAVLLAGASGVIGVDTGLTHLSAALEVPGVTIYGATSPELTGTRGKKHHCLQADFECAPCLQKECVFDRGRGVVFPCYEKLLPKSVWECLRYR